MLTHYADLPCYVALYLLPLRHPVLVARQLASIAELAPGRLTFGVGIGGEDPHELEICGVDPRTRGRRMDESLEILRELSEGKPVSYRRRVLRASRRANPSCAVVTDTNRGRRPVGRRDAARGRFGDGWLGIWVSPQAIQLGGYEQIAEHAAHADRDFERLRACDQRLVRLRRGGATLRARRSRPECRASTRCHSSRSSVTRPTGRPNDVADFLYPYIEAGCSVFNVIPCASDDETAVSAVAELRQLLTTTRTTPEHLFI